eukprot:scaffold94251_cov16-Tisochrysis_lutea.AAC.1
MMRPPPPWPKDEEDVDDDPILGALAAKRKRLGVLGGLVVKRKEARLGVMCPATLAQLKSCFHAWACQGAPQLNLYP